MSPAKKSARASVSSGDDSSRDIKYTLLLSEDEADKFDDVERQCRRTTGRRTIKKSAIIRAFIELAASDSTVARKLASHLDGS